MTNETFRIACALRLGAVAGVSHKCPSRAEVTTLGLHGMSCEKSKGRISRHGEANYVIARALRSAGVPTITCGML